MGMLLVGVVAGAMARVLGVMTARDVTGAMSAAARDVTGVTAAGMTARPTAATARMTAAAATMMAAWSRVSGR